MATKVVMEALSPTMEEGRLVEWKKHAGEVVAVGDVLAEVETDKAVMELVARTAGTLIAQVMPAGATVPVASVVGWIGTAGETVPPGAPARTLHPGGVQPNPAGRDRAQDLAPPFDPARPSAPAPQGVTLPEGDPVPAGRVRASPLARRIAADKGVDLRQLAGSGPKGRITKRDVERVSASPTVAARPLAVSAGFTDVPLSPLRKTIAQRLVRSLGPIPTYYLTAEADMERAAEARDALRARNAPTKFSFNDLVIRATAAALREHPRVNAWWMDHQVRQWRDVHVGVAVAVDEGVITPVIRHADQKSLREIAAEVHELADRARKRQLTPEEYTGATFSISNLGMFGVDEFTAIINPPEAAILAIGRIEAKPVVLAGEIVARRRMRMTMSCDHRVIDGATGADFLKTLVGMLENPLALVW